MDIALNSFILFLLFIFTGIVFITLQHQILLLLDTRLMLS